jgi:site-specific DNA recombinase
MKLAALYARSSKDRHDVSVDSQVTELKARAKADGYTIAAKFVDKALSGKDDDRPGFQEMIQAASSDDSDWSRLYVFDTARFSRSILDAATYENILQGKGIEIVYLQIPEGADQATTELVKQVFRGINRWHSLKSKSDAVRGMKENIRRGYRAGGIAPYGYILERESTGAEREGRPVEKSKLRIDPDTSTVVSEYFERRSRGEGRKSIAMDFNSRNIPSPRGGLWGHTTLDAFERNIQVYLGDTVWNRHGDTVNGKFVSSRWKDSDEWEVQNQTHKAIISKDVADAVIRQRRIRKKVASKPSDYLLTGTLYCGSCGSPYTGSGGYYRCSGSKRFGREYCSNSQISKTPIEIEMQRAIKEFVLVPEFTKDYIKAARSHMRAKPKSESSISSLEKKLIEVEKAILKWTRAFEVDGSGWETAIERIKALEAEKDVIAEKVGELRHSENVVPLTSETTDELLVELLERFEETMSLGDIGDRRELMGQVVEKIEIGDRFKGSRTRELVMHARPTTSPKLVTPRGFEPLFQA